MSALLEARDVTKVFGGGIGRRTETVALRRGWQFERMADDQIAVTAGGQWRDHALTLAWSGRDEMLRLICCFDLDPPEARMPARNAGKSSRSRAATSSST